MALAKSFLSSHAFKTQKDTLLRLRPTLPARCVWVLASLLLASPIFKKVPNQLNGGA